MRGLPTISATKISSFLNNFEVYGISVSEVITASGFDCSLLSSPDNRLSGLEAKKIIETAVRLTKDENLGLHQGERLSRGFSNILGYVLMNCSTLGECWTKYCRYEKIIDNTSISNFHIDDGIAAISNTTVDSALESSRQFTDFKIAGTLSYIKLLSNKQLELKEVHFNYPRPSDISEYERIFQCTILFEKESNALLFEPSQLDISIVEPNEKLLKMFEKNAQELLEWLNIDNTYTHLVSELMLDELSKGNLPSIEAIAQKLFISVRSLQLYLKKEETSYIKLVKEVRKSTAEKYLMDRNISVDEIAFVLGFSETSAFYRAFKLWTGQTPVQFRKSLLY